MAAPRDFGVTKEDNWLPALVRLEDFAGDFDRFYQYELFCQDWIVERPAFLGRPMGLKKHPVLNGKEYTFYHITHDGNIEAERVPNLRRMERIRWPRAFVEAAAAGTLNTRRTQRHTKAGLK